MAAAFTSPRLREEVERAERARVRGRFRESEPVETPPHPDPLHSPSKTGVNALKASGEREPKRRGCLEPDYGANIAASLVRNGSSVMLRRSGVTATRFSASAERSVPSRCACAGARSNAIQ